LSLPSSEPDKVVEANVRPSSTVRETPMRHSPISLSDIELLMTPERSGMSLRDQSTCSCQSEKAAGAQSPKNNRPPSTAYAKYGSYPSVWRGCSMSR
jgi:hypothetical protein